MVDIEIKVTNVPLTEIPKFITQIKKLRESLFVKPSENFTVEIKDKEAI